jgi:hypothetical protein
MMLNINITFKKDGTAHPWFYDEQGRRVRTRFMNWWEVNQQRDQVQRVKSMGEYGLQLIRDRVAKGIGADDAPMPPLSGRNFAVFERQGNVRVFVRREYRGYQGEKQRRGLKPIRDLRGTGEYGGGHMLDAIRINYLDDRRCEFGITTLPQRQKARNNERIHPWWGWSPSDVQKMAVKAQEMFKLTAEQVAASLGFTAAMNLASNRIFASRVRSVFRRAA